VSLLVLGFEFCTAPSVGANSLSMCFTALTGHGAPKHMKKAALELGMVRYKLDQAEIKNTIAAMGRRWIPNGGGVTFFSGSVECKLRIDHDPVITPEDVGKLREILGSRFDDLVFSKTSYRPTKKLIILGESDDSIAQLITFKERSPSLRFKKR